MPEQASHLSGKKSTESGRDCRFKGKLTWLSFPLAKGFHSGRENPALFARTLHPFLPLSTMPLATPPGTPPAPPQLGAPPSWHRQLRCPPSPPHLQSPVPAVRPRPRPPPPPARSAPHPSADSSARNSEPRGPETPWPDRAGPAAGKQRAPSVPRAPAPGPVRNPATPGGSPPRPFLSPAQHRLPKPGRLPARGPYSSSRWRARTDVIASGGPAAGGQ